MGSSWRQDLGLASKHGSSRESPTIAALDSSKEPVRAAQGFRMRGTALAGSAGATTQTSSVTETTSDSSITSSSDYDVLTEGGKDLTLNGDLLLHFDGASRTTAGSYSILKADSISGSFDNILIEGLGDDLYFGITKGGDNIQVTVSEDYFVGSTKAASLF